MTECESIRDLLVLFVEGALDSAQNSVVRAHLSGCAGCSREATEIESVRSMLKDPEIFAPEETYGWQLLPRSLAARAEPVSKPWWTPRRFSTLALTSTMAVTLALAVALTWFARSRSSPTPPTDVAAAHVAPGNEEFLRRMQTAYAREATARYLTECQDLLIDVVRAERNCAGEGYDVSAEVARARALLARKRLLDRELATPEVARAKNLCDELERFLVNLSTSQQCETRGELLRMEQFIRRGQLLLRINVLQSELS